MNQALPLSGKDIVLAIQRVTATIGADALVPGFQTESTYSDENELMDEQTKMGRILAYGNDSESFEATMYVDKGEGQRDIRQAKKNKEMLKVWEIETKPNADGEYDARFAYCLIESLEKSGESDSFAEFSTTMQVFGKSQEGTLTELPAGIEDAFYEFETPGETGVAEEPAG